jgi:threonine/homoserine/homoserine lactone efflux protein
MPSRPFRFGGRTPLADFERLSQRPGAIPAAAAHLDLDRAASTRFGWANAPGKGQRVSISSLLLFAAVYFVAVATPGPGVAALVARVLAHGLIGVAPFIAGYVVGDLIWLAIAATGLAVLAHEFAGVFIVLKFAGVAYLLYVAWGMARSSATSDAGAPPARAARGWRAFSGSLSLTLGNPKVIVFFLSIMPLVVDLDAMTPAISIEIAATSVIVLSATLFAYALAANRARAMLRSMRAMRLVHRAAAGVMAGVALAIATR